MAETSTIKRERAPRNDEPCVVCKVPFSETVEKSSSPEQYATLMFDRVTGRCIGYAHKMCGLPHPEQSLKTLKRAVCTRCGLPLKGDHIVFSGGAKCRDGGDCVLETDTIKTPFQAD